MTIVRGHALCRHRSSACCACKRARVNGGGGMTMRCGATLPYPIPPTWQGTSPSYDCTVIHSPNYSLHNSSNVLIPKHPPMCFQNATPPGYIFFRLNPLRTFVRTFKLLNVTSVTAVTALQNDTSQTTCFGLHQSVYPHTWDSSVV